MHQPGNHYTVSCTFCSSNTDQVSECFLYSIVEVSHTCFLHTYLYWYINMQYLIITVLVNYPQLRRRLLVIPAASSPAPSLEPLEQLSSYSQEPVKHKAGKSRAGWHKVTYYNKFLMFCSGTCSLLNKRLRILTYYHSSPKLPCLDHYSHKHYRCDKFNVMPQLRHLSEKKRP